MPLVCALLLAPEETDEDAEEGREEDEEFAEEDAEIKEAVEDEDEDKEFIDDCEDCDDREDLQDHHGLFPCCCPSSSLQSSFHCQPGKCQQGAWSFRANIVHGTVNASMPVTVAVVRSRAFIENEEGM